MYSVAIYLLISEKKYNPSFKMISLNVRLVPLC